MARAIKKVKVEGQRKHGKWFYIILVSIIVLVLAGSGTGIGIYVYNLTKDESFDYFSDYAGAKINYDVLTEVIEEDQYTDIFVFVYDDTTFNMLNPYTDSDDIKRIELENQTALGAEVKNFYDALNQLKQESRCEGVAFYLLNASLTSNSGILEDSVYGALATSPSFIYIHGETYSSTTKDDKETTISGSGVKVCTTYLKEARSYLEIIETL